MCVCVCVCVCVFMCALKGYACVCAHTTCVFAFILICYIDKVHNSEYRVTNFPLECC